MITPIARLERPRHVVIGIPCLLVGGTEAQTLMLVRALQGRAQGAGNMAGGKRDGGSVTGGYRVTVVCYFEHEVGVVEEFKRAGAEVCLLRWQRAGSVPRFIGRLAMVLRRLKPDIVHIQYMTPGLLPILAARLAGARCVLTTMNYPGTTHGRMAHVFVRLAAILCARVVCVSGAVEESWFGRGRETYPAGSAHRRSRLLMIHNAVDIRAVDAAVRVWG